MPVIAFSLGPMAIVARMTRVNLLETLSAEYVRLARARGHPDAPHRVALRPEERVDPDDHGAAAAHPGPADRLDLHRGGVRRPRASGRFFTTSALNRDYPMIMAMAMMIALLWGIMYLISDVLYAIIDPRVRLASKAA